MPTRLYRFHCTDGHDLVVDLRGRRIPTLALVRVHADRVALDLMTHGTQLDWSAWHVEVYDARGRVMLTKAFTDVRVDIQGQGRRSLRGLETDRAGPSTKPSGL